MDSWYGWEQLLSLAFMMVVAGIVIGAIVLAGVLIGAILLVLGVLGLLLGLFLLPSIIRGFKQGWKEAKRR